MKKILYLCCLLLMANQTIAAAAVAEDRPSIGARLCALFAFQRPAARAVIPAPAVPDERSLKILVFTEILEHPKTLEQAVKTWRVCRARYLGIITLPEEGPSISDLHSAEDHADDFIIKQISKGLTADEKVWLRCEIHRTDPDRGRAVFPGIFTDK